MENINFDKDAAHSLVWKIVWQYLLELSVCISYNFIFLFFLLSGEYSTRQNNDQNTRDYSAAATAKSLQLCPTLCNPIDGSPPGSPVTGILQARTLEWVAISFSNAWKWKVKLLSSVQLVATPWTAAYQALPSMGFSRQESWSGVPLPSPVGGFKMPIFLGVF